MALGLVGWSAGCVWAAHQVALEPSLGGALGVLVFMTWWVGIAAGVVHDQFLRESVCLCGDVIEFRRSALFPLTRRRVPIHEIRRFRMSGMAYLRVGVEDHHGIELVSAARPLQFGRLLTRDQCVECIARLNRTLLEYREQNVADAAASERLPCQIVRGLQDGKGEGLLLENTLRQPPSDSNWSVSAGDRSLVFLHRGRMKRSVVAFLFLLEIVLNFMLVLLWSSLIASFTAHAEEATWLVRTGLMLFAIIFTPLGLLALFSFVYAVAEPIHRTVLDIRNDCIIRTDTWLMVKMSWVADLTGLARLEVRSQDPDISRDHWHRHFQMLSVAGQHELAFVGKDGEDLYVLRSITEGEARWLGGEVLRERAGAV